jgi:ketosteroid isomerase-like protein
MSSDSTDRWRPAFEAFNRTHKLDLENYHPDVEWHTRRDLPDSGVYRGREEIARMVADWVEAFENLHNEPGEIIELAGKTVMDMHVHGRVRGSGEEVDMHEVWVITERDEKIVEIREYSTREEALRSLGRQVEGRPQTSEL